MKKVYKVICVVLIIISIYSITFDVLASDIWELGNKFLNAGASSQTGFNSAGANNAFKGIIEFLWGLGLLAIVISTVVLGIKYMLVLPKEKSRLKQATTPYIIGVVCIFGALTIWRFIIYLLEGSMLGG